MPHFTIEYSANLDGRVDIGKVSKSSARPRWRPASFRSAASGSAPISCEHYAIADGRRISAFSTWCFGSARAAISPTRKKAGEHIFKALSAYLDPVFADSKFALSFDMQINDKETSWKRNNIHDALKVEAAHG